MRLLLDTHVFLWVVSAPEKLSTAARSACEDRSNRLVLSVASVWEMQIKVQLGKLRLASSLDRLIDTQRRVNDFQILSVELEHVFALSGLAPHHKDPFDRLLIAQADSENLTLVSADGAFSHYGISLLW